MLRNELIYPTATARFLEESSSRIRTDESRKTYRKVLRGLQSAYPGLRVSECREDHLVAFCGQGGVAPATVAQRRNVTQAFFQWAHWKGLAPTDPSVGLKRVLAVKVKPVKHHHWLGLEQVRAVLDACTGPLGDRDRVLILTAVNTGLRRAELAGLRWSHVDLTQREVRVVGKGEKPALVGIPARLAEVLFTWRGEVAKGLGRPPVGDPVFPAARSLYGWRGGTRSVEILWHQPLGRNGIYSIVRGRGAQAGIDGLAPHDLRRTFAGLAEEQQDLLTVSKMLRHEDVGTTQRYLEKNPRRGVEAGQSFDLAL